MEFIRKNLANIFTLTNLFLGFVGIISVLYGDIVIGSYMIIFAALFDLLEQNNIAGAAIDVFSEEPYNGPFLTLDNVVLTPHLGSYAAEGKLQMEIGAVKNLIESLR